MITNPSLFIVSCVAKAVISLLGFQNIKMSVGLVSAAEIQSCSGSSTIW